MCNCSTDPDLLRQQRPSFASHPHHLSAPPHQPLPHAASCTGSRSTTAPPRGTTWGARRRAGGRANWTWAMCCTRPPASRTRRWLLGVGGYSCAGVCVCVGYVSCRGGLPAGKLETLLSLVDGPTHTAHHTSRPLPHPTPHRTTPHHPIPPHTHATAAPPHTVAPFLKPLTCL